MADHEDDSNLYIDNMVSTILSQPEIDLKQFLKDIILSDKEHRIRINSLKEKLLEQENQLSEMSLEI